MLAIAPYVSMNVRKEGKDLKAAEVATWSVDQFLDYAEAKALPQCLQWMADNKKVAKALRKAQERVEDHDDPATASMIEIWLDKTEKRTWFLCEAARGASNDGH